MTEGKLVPVPICSSPYAIAISFAIASASNTSTTLRSPEDWAVGGGKPWKGEAGGEPVSERWHIYYLANSAWSEVGKALLKH